MAKAGPVKVASAPDFQYRIKASDHGSDATVYLFGDIGESWFEETIEARTFVRDFAAIEAGKINIYINSRGGSVPDGLAMYNAIRNHPATVDVIISGQAVSIASLIAMAGNRLLMEQNSLLMIHAPWTFAYGNSVDFRDAADVLDTHARAMASSYAAKTRKSFDELMPLLTDGADHWFTADEAVDGGFADGIADTEADNPIAAYFSKPKKSRFLIPAAIAAKLNPEGSHMAQKQNPAAAEEKKPDAVATNPTPAPADNVAAIESAAEARAMQRIGERNAQIKTAFAMFLGQAGIRDLQDECMADTKITAEQAREKLLAKLGEGCEPIARDPVIHSGVSDRDKFIEAASNALLARTGAAEHDRSNPYRGMRLHELARAALKRVGVNTDGETPEEFAPKALTHGVIRGAQTTSDFPVILENTLHKMVLTGFRAQSLTWDKICKIGDVTDFRAWKRIVPGMIGNLDGVNEDGEYKNKAIPDGTQNSIQATRKGNIIQITPEVLVDDNVGYVFDMARGLGMAGGRAIERAVYTLLESNPTLSDSVALFHANHGNLAASGAAPTVLLLDSAASAMAQQTAPGDDAEYLDIRPAVALANTGLRGTMMVLVDAQYDPDTANKLQRPNQVRGIVQDIVSTPRIAAAPWYLFADPMIAPVLEVVFLNGQREPRLTMEENFRTSGLAWKVELPFGAGVIDYRGAYKNPGV